MKLLIKRNVLVNYRPHSFLIIRKYLVHLQLLIIFVIILLTCKGPNLAKKIPESAVSHCSYLSHNYANSTYFNAATTQEVSEIVNSLRPGTAAGYDKIPMFAVKDSIDLISGPLTHIINLSISTGVVPDKMKIARVIPLFKSGDHGHFQNYRPISVLPIFFQIFGKNCI